MANDFTDFSVIHSIFKKCLRCESCCLETSLGLLFLIRTVRIELPQERSVMEVRIAGEWTVGKGFNTQ